MIIKKSEPNFSMIVVTHKDFDDSFLPTGYHVIKVGKANVSLKENWLSDNSGNNISKANPFYCELTGQYWFWKNYPGNDDDIIGLSHYRRYFFNYKKKSKSWHEDILNESDARNILEKHKVIMAITSVKNKGIGRLYKKKDNSKEDHWIIIEEIIKEYYPEYFKSFKKVLYGRYIIWGNMFVTTRKIFNNYSEWVFGILSKFDNYLALNHRERIPREDGFLSEDLLMVYMYKEFSKKEIYKLEIRNVEKDPMKEYCSGRVKFKLIRFIRHHHNLLLFSRGLRIGYLLLKRR
jgi:hypothetical protein